MFTKYFLFPPRYVIVLLFFIPLEVISGFKLALDNKVGVESKQKGCLWLWTFKVSVQFVTLHSLGVASHVPSSGFCPNLGLAVRTMGSRAQSQLAMDGSCESEIKLVVSSHGDFWSVLFVCLFVLAFCWLQNNLAHAVWYMYWAFLAHCPLTFSCLPIRMMSLPLSLNLCLVFWKNFFSFSLSACTYSNFLFLQVGGLMEYQLWFLVFLWSD